MEIKLHRSDLKKYFSEMNLKDVRYKHLNWKAKKLIRVAGVGSLYEYGDIDFMVIIPAKFSVNFYLYSFYTVLFGFIICLVRNPSSIEFLIRMSVWVGLILLTMLLIKLWRDYVR